MSLLVIVLFAPTSHTQPAGLPNNDSTRYGLAASQAPNSVSSDSVPEIEGLSSDKSVAVIVQESLYANVSSAISQYCKDLQDSGYNTILFTGQVSDHEDLKGKLLQWYENSSLVGAALIGRLPYAQFHHPASEGWDAETFICDLYLMDLDGTWSDTAPHDGIYDGHSASAPDDIYPEIFVGRIDPTCLSWGSGTAAHVNDYLARLHAFRTGGFQRTNRALVYVDDDWSGEWGAQWDEDVGLAYANRTFIQDPLLTNAMDWLSNRVSQDYQWTHICVHSSATTHYFGPGGVGEGTASSSDIRAAGPTSNFYNLFACSGAEWTATDDLAVTYAFSGNSSFAAIGSTKTGSMMDCNYFYFPLHNNETLGNALVNWFSNALTSSSTAGSDYVQWYYGMAIVGDPLLTIIYDCTVLPPTISSTTHPDQYGWTNNPNPHFNWSIPTDVNGISGFYYAIDQTPKTKPIPDGSTYTTANGTSITTGLSDGTWYIHVVARDSLGNIGKTAAHYRVNIETESPTVTIISPSPKSNLSTDQVDFSWTALDSGSGYSYAQVWLDSPNSTVYKGPSTSTVLTGLSHGAHILNVTVFDFADNTETKQVSFIVDLMNPTVTITQPIDGSSTGSSLVLSWTWFDVGSGCHHAEVRVDGSLVGVVDSSGISLAIDSLSPGTHRLNVTVFDWANRASSDEVSITVRPPLSEYILAGAVLTAAAVIVVGIVLRRRFT